MKADGTKLRMELTNVSAELRTANTQLSSQKTEMEKLRKEQLDLTAETKKQIDDQMALDQADKDIKDGMIHKLRIIAKQYKGTNDMNKFLM